LKCCCAGISSTFESFWDTPHHEVCPECVKWTSSTFQFLSYSNSTAVRRSMLSSLKAQYIELYSSNPREFRFFKTQPRNEYGYDHGCANSIRSDEHVNPDECFSHGCHSNCGYVNVNGRLWRLQTFSKLPVFPALVTISGSYRKSCWSYEVQWRLALGKFSPRVPTWFAQGEHLPYEILWSTVITFP